MRKGFTLLELVIVIIILGVLATLGLGQYSRMVERSRGAEARSVIGQIRTQAAAFRLGRANRSLAANAALGLPAFGAADAGLSVGAPGDDEIPGAQCGPQYYFRYSVGNITANGLQITGTRCGAGTGKGGGINSPNPGTVTLTTNFNTGQDDWSGSY